MRVLIISTYDLGTQPLIPARLKASLKAGGHGAKAVDLSVSAMDPGDLSWADAVILFIPMHTALSLAKELAETIRSEREDLPFCFFGLYAPAAYGAKLLSPGDIAIAGDNFTTLFAWLDSFSAKNAFRSEGGSLRIDLGPPKQLFRLPPDRTDFLPLDNYLHYLEGDVSKTVATLETVSGCSHKCRHCPVPVVYGGRTRPTPEAEILADAAQQIAQGASHIHFSDPDFFNRPAYSLGIMEKLKKLYPDLTFDATIKISHLLKYETLLPWLAKQGCTLVITALEQVNDRTLAILDKGHTKSDARRAFRLLRQVGIEPRPSLLPFTPWTTANDLVELADFVAENDLAANIDPVQWSIRLLIPPGSLLSEEEVDMPPGVLEEQEESLSRGWHSPDPRLDGLAAEIGNLAEKIAGIPPREAYLAVRKLIFSALGIPYYETETDGDLASPIPETDRPRLSENWFCCAVPTGDQMSKMSCH